MPNTVALIALRTIESQKVIVGTTVAQNTDSSLFAATTNYLIAKMGHGGCATTDKARVLYNYAYYLLLLLMLNSSLVFPPLCAPLPYYHCPPL
jgi:hypothetical protein